ncbi:MAG: hypothetical protein RLZZ50_1288 [Verrucomicrobiota bacterium]
MIKKTTLLALASTLGLFATIARSEGWNGYMNVFFNNGGAAGGYIFGSGWGVSDLKTTVAVSNTGTYIGDRLVLEPNFNTYTDSLAGTDGDRAFWTNSTDGGVTAGAAGNKFMEANTFVETASISTASTSFSGTIDSYTLNGSYTAIAFIKVLNPGNGYSLDVFQTANLVSGASFNLSADLSAHQGKLLQQGFMVSGLNANPNASLGSVTVTTTAAPIPEPSTYSAFFGLAAAGVALGLRRRRS